MLLGVRLAEVDLVNLEHGEVALAVLGRPNLAGQAVAGAQIEAANLAGRNIDVVRAGEVGAVRGAQEAEAVLQDFQGARPKHVLAGLRLLAHDGGNDLLLARAGQVVQAQVAAHIDQLAYRLGFKVFEVHRHSFCSLLKLNGELLGIRRPIYGQGSKGPDGGKVNSRNWPS